MNNYCVITTVNKPTKAVEKLYEHFGHNLIIVGDKKTPQGWNHHGVVPIRNSNKIYAPDNHYSRKNLGYLVAMQNGATSILSTDDDNIPNYNWKMRGGSGKCDMINAGGWFNVYRYFDAPTMWPRGFPLNRAIGENYASIDFSVEYKSSIQQGMADGEADVDAIYRFLFKGKASFVNYKSVLLHPNTWCPFNSQTTWFFPRAYALMYLPIYANFRCTDIWSSFVGQRCLWELGEGVTFHSPSEVFQDRNEHDLMEDFKDEIQGYLKNDKIVEILGSAKLKQGDEFVCENMFTCYHALVSEGILPPEELISLNQWLEDYEDIAKNMG